MNRLKFLSLIFGTFLVASSAFSQNLIDYPVPSLELEIEGYGGKNGAAVAYNPEKRLYYCVIAGNTTYPLETFDRSGRNVYQADAMNDMRGIWWNPKAKALEGNCYADGGIVSIGLTGAGYAGAGNSIVFAGTGHQPGDQSLGVFDPKKKEILYLEDGDVIGYSRKDGSPTGTNINLELPVDEININWTSVIFTGIKKMELGVLDTYEKKVYLFNRKDGSHTATIQLPSGTDVYESFNFSYANGYIFLFNQDDRKWVGYKIL